MTAAADPSRPSRKMRWWMPILILLAGIGTAVYLQLDAEMDNGMRFSLQVMTGLIAGILLTGWYIFFTGLPWLQKFALTGLAVLLVVSAFKTVRVDGASGDMRLRLAWKWSPKPDE